MLPRDGGRDLRILSEPPSFKLGDVTAAGLLEETGVTIFGLGEVCSGFISF